MKFTASYGTRFHNSLLESSILREIYPTHTFPLYFPKIRFNIILLFMPRFTECSLPLRFRNQNFVSCHYVDKKYISFCI